MTQRTVAVQLAQESSLSAFDFGEGGHWRTRDEKLKQDARFTSFVQLGGQTTTLYTHTHTQEQLASRILQHTRQTQQT